MGSLPGKATVVAVASTIAIVAAIAPETFVVAAKKTVAIGLLVLIPTIVSAGVAVAIPVKVGSLRIIALTSLRIARASVEAVLVTLVYGNLIGVAVTTIAAVAIAPAVAAGAIVATIITIATVVPVNTVVPVTIVVTVTLTPIAVATILIALILTILITVRRPLGLRRRARS